MDAEHRGLEGLAGFLKGLLALARDEDANQTAAENWRENSDAKRRSVGRHV